MEEIRAIQRRAKDADARNLGMIRSVKRERTEDENEDGPLRQARRQKVTAYMELDGDEDEDASYVEVEGPERPMQASIQLD